MHDRLVKALIARSGHLARLIDGQCRGWASATFVGARHVLTFAVPGDAIAALVEGLSEHEFALPGQIVADIAVDGVQPHGLDLHVVIDALTVEAA